MAKSREVGGIKIESNIPIPGRVGIGRTSPYPWAQLEVGESFFIPQKAVASIGGSKKWFELKLLRKFARRAENGGVRVWRIS